MAFMDTICLNAMLKDMSLSVAVASACGYSRGDNRAGEHMCQALRGDPNLKCKRLPLSVLSCKSAEWQRLGQAAGSDEHH